MHGLFCLTQYMNTYNEKGESKRKNSDWRHVEKLERTVVRNQGPNSIEKKTTEKPLENPTEMQF